MDQRLVNVLIAVIVLGLLFWLITVLPLPEPFHMIAYVVLVVIAVIWVINMLRGSSRL